jgi:DNA polymerase-3 subunit delta'
MSLSSASYVQQNTPNLYPWLMPLYQQLARDDLRGHAFLLLGATGLGQQALIHALLAYHLQTQQLEDHPDVLKVSRLEGKRDISVEQIRQLTHWVQHSSHGHLGRWVVIEEIERMNPSAANSLLKTLEEPPKGVRFLLTAQRAGKLLPTILSRCQQWVIQPPSNQIAIEWLQDQVSVASNECEFALKLHHNAPLSALQWLSGKGVQTWRDWQKLWQMSFKTQQLNLELIHWANEDPERFFTQLASQSYVALQEGQEHFLPLIRLSWHAQQLLRQNASKELLIDQVLQAFAQVLNHQYPHNHLNRRRGMLG